MRQVCTGGWRWDRPPRRRALPLLGAVVALTALAAVSSCAPLSGRGGTSSHAPTATATATETPGPPTPTPTAQERVLITLVQQAVGNRVQDVGATYSAADGSVIVTVTGPWSAPPSTDADISAAQEKVKTICFLAQKALWTSASGIPLRQVAVNVLGPLTVGYSVNLPGSYGWVILTAATAARFHWASLSPDMAWNDYDTVFLLPEYEDVA